MEYKIYVLRNPITNEIFYVGATRKKLIERLKAHYFKVKEAERGAINWNKRLLYLKEMLPQKAIIRYIVKCNKEEVHLLEKKYIELISKKYNLTNQTIGGLGGDTFNMLPKEQKIITGKLISDRIKGIKKPEGFAENLSKARMGYGNPAAGKTKYPPIVLDNNVQIIIFKNSIEANKYFNNKHTWSSLVSTARHNKTFPNKWFFKKSYSVSFKDDCDASIKDIVESLLEKEGYYHVYNKHNN